MLHAEEGLPGLPLLLSVVPFISQIKASSVELLRHRMSLLQLPLKSPTVSNEPGFGFGFGFAVVQDPLACETSTEARPLALL